MDKYSKCLDEFNKAPDLEVKVCILGKVIMNHMVHEIHWQNVKLNFILIFMGILVAMWGFTAAICFAYLMK